MTADNKLGATAEELTDALERIVGALQSNGAWKVANALKIAKAAIAKSRGAVQ